MNTFLIARRDLGSYLQGFSAYAIIAAVLFIDGLLFNVLALGDTAEYSHKILEQFFYNSAGTTMIAGVILSMRAVAEERNAGTDVLYRTSPVTDGQVIFGKYLAAMAVLSLITLLTAYIPMMIFVNGKVSYAHIAVGYLGLLGLGSATTAIGIFGSSLFKNQVVCGFLSGVIVVLLLTLWKAADVTEPPFADVFAYGALFQKHYLPFMEGRLPVSSVVYYVSLTMVFLTMATQVLKGRRWQ